MIMGHNTAPLLIGQQIRDNLPQTYRNTYTTVAMLGEEFRSQNREFMKKQNKTSINITVLGLHESPDIPNGTDVRVTTGEHPTAGTVLDRTDTPRSYIVITPGGES